MKQITRQERENEEREFFVVNMMLHLDIKDEADRKFMRFALDAAWVYGRNQALSRHGVVLRDERGKLVMPKHPKKPRIAAPRLNGAGG